jgi:tetratricopeptide (TPR) repeat protein
MNDVGSLGMCHRALGTMYLDNRNWKSAQDNFKKAMLNHKKAEHRSAYEATIIFLGLAYFYEGKYDDAKEHIDKAVLITSRRKDVSFYDITSRAVQILLRSKLSESSEKDIDNLGKEVIASSSVKETNREYFYISQSYLNIGNQKKANKYQKLAKKGLLKSSEKITDEKYKNDYLNTDMHKYMLNDKAVPFISDIYKEKKLKKHEKDTNPAKLVATGESICPQYGEHFNFCPSCAYNNTKNDFTFCPDCGTSLEKR